MGRLILGLLLAAALGVRWVIRRRRQLAAVRRRRSWIVVVPADHPEAADKAREILRRRDPDAPLRVVVASEEPELVDRLGVDRVPALLLMGADGRVRRRLSERV